MCYAKRNIYIDKNCEQICYLLFVFILMPERPRIIIYYYNDVRQIIIKINFCNYKVYTFCIKLFQNVAKLQKCHSW